ncbi:hypothetical protein BKA93DRAFT_306974 [Sparassis latifolia]
MGINKDVPFSDALLPRLCYLYPDLTNIYHPRLHHLDDFYLDSGFVSGFTMSNDSDTVSDYQDERADVLHPLPTHFAKPSSDPLPSHTPPTTPKRKAFSMPTCGSKPTPVQPKGSGMLRTGQGTIDQATKKYIDLTLIPHVKRDFTVLDFVKHVWKYNPQKLLDILSNRNKQNLNLSLSGARCRRYWARAQMHEKMMYDELCGIFGDLLHAVDDQRSIPANFINMREHTVEGNYGSYKPDISYSVISDCTKQRWEWTISCVEVKRNGGKFDCDVKGDVPIDVNKLKDLITNLPVRKRKDAPHEEDELNVVSERPRKRARSHDVVLPGGPQTRKRKEPSDKFDQPEPQAKRSRSHAEKAGAEDGEKALEPEVDIGDAEQLPEFKKLTATERQAVKYELEMMSHGVRSYSSGLTVDGLTVHLWYADRMGLIKSEPFNFVEEPHLLLLVLSAMGSADLVSMGISPFMTFGQLGFQGYDNAYLEIPDQQALDINGDAMGALAFAVDTSRGILTDFGIVGRGTTVVPIKTTANTAQFGDAALVAKMSWQPQERASEASLVRLVRQSLGKKKPDMLQYIVDLKCSVTRSMEAMGLPRAFLPDAHLESEDTRELRLLVLTKYEPLQSVSSVDEFKKVFTDVVRAHRYVWKHAQVLHRDISVDNIMFQRSGDSVCGILCDWDLALHKPDGDSDQLEFKMLVEMPAKKASEDPTEEPVPTDAVTPATDVEAKATDRTNDQAVEMPKKEQQADQAADGDKMPKRKPRYRTGTGPYMALDLLLCGSTPYHRYRHDLESFFYLLAWFCSLFDPDEHKFREVGLWEANTLVDIGRAKRDFLHEPEEYKKTMAKAHPKYAAVAKTWVSQLRILVARANPSALRDLRNERAFQMENGDTADVALYDSSIRMHIHDRNEVITYEKFMQCLGAEP